MTATPLVAGVLLSALGGIVRVKAWHGAAADACAPTRIRYRDVVVAHLGGAGFNGIIPAHGGDAIKLALLKRRTEGAPFGLLLGSLAPPAAVEALVTALLLVWALSTGVLGAPSPGQIPLPLVGAAAAVAAAVLWLLARRAPRLLSDVRHGMTALRRPRRLARSVVPWVLAARLIRLGSLACFFIAVGLPVTVTGVVLLMAIQGGVGSSGPASTPVRIAVIAASLPAAIGGMHVGLDRAAQLLGAAQLSTMAGNLAISVLVLAVTLRTVSPRRLAAYCRGRAPIRPTVAVSPVAAAAQPAPAVTKP
jgi:hypothetical protein